MAYVQPMMVIPFSGFTQFTGSLPSFYWNVYSSEQRIKHMCYEICKLAEYSDYLADKINADHKLIEELQNDFDDFKEGAYDEYYQEMIYKWIQDNMQDIVEAAIRMVFFGLTIDGYFVAYIPDTWNDIDFDTGAVYGTQDYGRLILRYDVDSPHWVDQTR